MRHYLNELTDLSVEETGEVLKDAAWLKKGRKTTDDLDGRHVGFIAMKRDASPTARARDTSADAASTCVPAHRRNTRFSAY